MPQRLIESLERRTFPSADSVSATVLPNTFIDTDPEEPGYLGNIQVSWTRASTSPIDGYHVYRSYDGSHYDRVATVASKLFLDSDLGTGAKFFYKVRPFTQGGGDQASLGTATAITIMQPPSFSTGADADGALSVNIFDEDDVATAFRLRWAPRDDPSAPGHSKVLTAIEQSDGRDYHATASFTITGLDPATVYDIRVTKLNSVTSSGPAESSEVPLAPPTDIKAQPLPDETIRVSWTNNSTHETGFKVTWIGPSTHKSLDVGKDVRTVIIDGLEANVGYSFNVEALDGKSESGGQDVDFATRVSPIDYDFSSNPPYDTFAPVKTDIHSGSDDVASDVAVQPDGKVIVVGTSRGNFEVVRYNADGTLDTTFGKRGKKAVDFGGNDAAHSVTLTAQGNILVVGTTGHKWALAELPPNGDLDSQFSPGWRLINGFGASSDAWSVAIDPTDPHRFYVAGFDVDSEKPREATVVRYFDYGGIDPNWEMPSIPEVTGKPVVMAVQPDGKVVTAAQRGDGIVLARFTTSGTPDTQFGRNGQALVQMGNAAQNVYGIALQPNGAILICGSEGKRASSVFALARLTRTGVLDTTLGSSGIVTTSFGKNAGAVAHDVAVLQTGEIVAVGPARGDFAVARYKPSGALDHGFDRDGMVTMDFGSPADVVSALSLDKLGTIYAAGTSDGDFAVAHYFVAPVNAPSDILAVPEDGVQVTWTNHALDETAVSLERAESLDGPWITVYVSKRDDEAYYDPSVIRGTRYFYRVTAIRGSKQSLPDVSGPVTFQ